MPSLTINKKGPVAENRRVLRFALENSEKSGAFSRSSSERTLGWGEGEGVEAGAVLEYY